MTTATATRTRTRQQHWCSAAPRKNRDQVAPDASCECGSALACRTVALVAVSERRFANRAGQVRVTWKEAGDTSLSGMSMTWESE